MKTNVTYGNEVQKQLFEGVKILFEAVSATLGPKGRTVIIQSPYGPAHVTKDGVTVAKSVDVEDKIPALGAQIVQQAAAKTVEKAGDGTTNSIILAHAIIQEALKLMAVGYQPGEINKELDSLKEPLLDYIRKYVKEVSPFSTEVKEVARVSSNADEQIAELVAQAIAEVGKDGVITVQEAKGTDTYVERQSGFTFDRGFLSPYFINDPDKMRVEIENPYILLYDAKLRSDRDLTPILSQVAKQRRPLIVIAREIEAQALGLLVVNRMKAGLDLCAIKAPAFGDRQTQILQDLAAYTGAHLITESEGKTIHDASIEDLGQCQSIKVTQNETVIIGGLGSQERIDERLSLIKASLEQADNSYTTEKLLERYAKLTTGVAAIFVGAYNSSELKEKKDRLDDAIQATQAALAEGIVPGGGTMLLRASQSLQGDSIGVSLIKKALESPLRILARNAGLSEDLMVARVTNLPPTHGVDISTNEELDMFEAGIIDPFKVIRVALENAISVAKLIISAQVTLTAKDIEHEAMM